MNNLYDITVYDVRIINTHHSSALFIKKLFTVTR